MIEKTLSLESEKFISLKSKLDEFLEKFGEELEMCNSDGFEKISEFQTIRDYNTIVNLLKKFYFEFEDDLDACFPEAFDIIYYAAKEHGIEVY